MLKQSFKTTHQTVTICTTNRGETLEQLLNTDAFSKTTPVFAEQVHAALVTVVQNTTAKPLPAADGMITKNPNLTLVIRHADCLPIIFWHDSGVFGALHAGRKSTVAGITTIALNLLESEFGITENVQFWFGPAICKKCYQVDRETDKHFDLASENSKQIDTWFVQRTHTIHASDICTLCSNDEFYSYRGDGADTKMNYTAVRML